MQSAVFFCSLKLFDRSAMERHPENVCRQQPAFISASSEEMFARRNYKRNLDKEAAKALERPRLYHNADARGSIRVTARIEPRIGEKELGPASPRVARCCPERSHYQCFRQCVGCRDRTRS